MLLRRQPPSDTQLVQAVLRGDKQKFARLVDRYRNLVYASILARVPNIDDADDLAQESFLKAFHRLGALHDPRKFGSWVRRIADNLSISLLRSRAAHEKALLSVAPPEPDPSDRAYEQQEEERIVWEVISRLPDEFRQVILLFYIEDYSREQVAQFLDLPVEAVKTRLRRARERLRGDLEDALERKTRDVVRRKRRGKDFTRRVMAGLPLALWTLPRPPVFWARWGWGVHATVTGLLGIGLVGLIAGWWPVPDRQPPPGHEIGPMPAHVRLASAEEYLHFLDRTRFPRTLEDTPSIFGSAPLGQEAVRQQELALRGGLDGRLEWTFDTDAEGWQARAVDYTQQLRPPLPMVVRDGVLHIDLPARGEGRVRAVELVSPELGYDCRLFEGIEVRARIDHDRPQPGGLHVHWTTPRNRLFPGGDPATWQRHREQGSPSFHFGNYRHRGISYTPQWQNMVFDDLTTHLEPGSGATNRERPVLSWEGSLVDLRLIFLLAQPGPNAERDPLFRPGALEIDNIVLRGSRSGVVDLAPPPAIPAADGGKWLDGGRFYPLNQRGLEHPLLGDLDGDGDLDLVITYWWRHPLRSESTRGWIPAYNDGRGRFASGLSQEVAGVGRGRLGAADLDRDGLIDLIRGDRCDTVSVLLNRGNGEFGDGPVWADEYLIGAGDVDGDGDADVVTARTPDDWTPPARFAVRLRVNHGDLQFEVSDLPSPRPERGWLPQGVADYDGDGRAELVWTRWWIGGPLQASALISSEFTGRGWQRWTEIPFQVPELTQTHTLYSGLAYVGDIDHDGNWDVGAPLGIFWSDAGEEATALGIEVRSTGREGSRAWLPRKVHLAQPFTRKPMVAPQDQDLDGDGLADPVFVDLNYRRGPSLLVLRGRPWGLPTQEGRYPLPGWPRGWVCGDVDGDGGDDVVVVTEGVWAAGAYVLRNIATGSRALPDQIAGH